MMEGRGPPGEKYGRSRRDERGAWATVLPRPPINPLLGVLARGVVVQSAHGCRARPYGSWMSERDYGY